MRGMEFRNTRVPCLPNSFRLAIALSLLLHAAVLFVNFSFSGPASGPVGNSADADPVAHASPLRPRLQASLTRPPAPPSPAPAAVPEAVTRQPAQSPARPAKQPKLATPTGIWANRSWSKAERADMDNFLNELGTQARPPDGRELSKRALAMARQMGRSAADEGENEALGQPDANGKAIEPFSLEMYFNAFVSKLNRSAAFVKNDPRPRGSHKALVQISLNPDGSLKSYRVLHSGDQEAEIAYIKSVVDRASPFSAFPPDIRNARD